MYNRVLMTGADGVIGKMLRKELRGVYPVLRLSHRRPFGDAQPGEEIVLANLDNYDEVDAAMEGVDAVIHLGGKAEEGTWDVVLKSNVMGAFNTFEAARRHGVKRFIFASTNHLIGYYRRDRKLTVDDPPRPDCRYAATKVFGEALARLYADKHGMSVICQRIGSFQPRPLNVRMLSCWLSHRDMVQLTRVCLDAPLDTHFEVVWGVSGNDRSWWDNSPAERLGFKPLDNSEEYAEEIFEAQRKALEDEAAQSKSGGTDVADQAAVVSAIKAVQGKELPAEGLFQGGPYCAMEFNGDLDKID